MYVLKCEVFKIETDFHCKMMSYLSCDSIKNTILLSFQKPENILYIL